RHADCRQRKLADFLCTGGIIQGRIRCASIASGNNVLFYPVTTSPAGGVSSNSSIVRAISRSPITT
ncbi:hypothetical protein F9Z54_21740, partial [Escherichia coli]